MKTDELNSWLETDPALDFFYAAGVDLNGVWRGKRFPLEELDAVMGGKMRMPVSALCLDIWGRDIANSPLVFASGDRDGMCAPTRSGPVAGEYGERKTLLLPFSMTDEEGTPSPVDPRNILETAIARAAKAGLTPVMAIELEFYLFARKGRGHARGPEHHGFFGVFGPGGEADRKERRGWRAQSWRGQNRRALSAKILDLDALEALEPFLDSVYANARLAGIEAEAAISEGGAGQFEINLLHSNDALKMADDALLFKRIVHASARAHGLGASFMPKPYHDEAGSGLHVHFSLIDEKGANIFTSAKADEGTKGSAALHHAVGGLLASMKECMLIWAPHQNSYRRLKRESHAPTTIDWGYENRTAAIRIPGGNPAAKRIEHRVSGADANPYLVLAALIHGVLDGIERKTEPSAPITGNAYEAGSEQLPEFWIDAIREFEQSTFIETHFPKMFCELFAATKYQELREFSGRMTPYELASYRDVL